MLGKHPAHDHGTSVLPQFVVSEELIRVAALDARAKAGEALGEDSEPILPAVRLLKDLFSRGSLDLAGGQKPGFRSSGALKAIGWVENLEDIELPRLLKPTVARYNGTPILLTTLGTMHRDASGEWMCIDLDFRMFTWLSRSLLFKLRKRFKEVSVHVAFVIQGTQDHELPEVVLGDFRIHGMDIEQTAWVDDPPFPAQRKPHHPPPKTSATERAHSFFQPGSLLQSLTAKHQFSALAHQLSAGLPCLTSRRKKS